MSLYEGQTWLDTTLTKCSNLPTQSKKTRPSASWFAPIRSTQHQPRSILAKTRNLNLIETPDPLFIAPYLTSLNSQSWKLHYTLLATRLQGFQVSSHKLETTPSGCCHACLLGWGCGGFLLHGRHTSSRTPRGNDQTLLKQSWHSTKQVARQSQ